jgi:ribosomal protein S18 acetylase RimI-like enzyme
MTIKNFNLDNLPDDLILVLNQHANFFTSFSWYQLFINTVNPNNYAFLADEEHEIILPVKFDNSGFYRTLMSLSNFYSPIYDIPSAQKCAIFVKKLQQPWDILKLQPVNQNDATETVTQLKKLGIPAISFFCFGNWYLEVNGRSYQTYFAGLSSRVKNTVTRKTKQFLAMPNTKLVIFSSENEALETAISSYNNVYKASWKHEESHPDFISGLCRLAASQNALRLGIAYIDDVAIAAQLWIVADNTAYIYKLAYDEAYKNYGVGSVLTATLMQYVIDVDKVKIVDYLTGDDAYKKDWMSHRQERWGIIAFNTSTLRGLLAMFKAFSVFYLKKLHAKFL